MLVLLIVALALLVVLGVLHLLSEPRRVRPPFDLPRSNLVELEICAECKRAKVKGEKHAHAR